MPDALDAVLESEVFPEIADAVVEIVDLPDAARPEVWASSMLAIWREPGSDVDPAVGDRRLVAWLVERGDHAAAVVAAALGGVIDDEDLRGLVADGAGLPAWVPAIGTARGIGAARIRRRGAESLVLVFGHDDDHRHTMLVELADGRLSGLSFGPALDTLLEGVHPDDLEFEPVELHDAALEVEEAWRRALDHGDELGDDYLMNHLLAERRLRGLLGDRTADLARLADPARTPGTDDAAERAELDAWALRTLRAAIDLPAADAAPEAMVEIVAGLIDPAVVARRRRSEREALSALEWADWLGVVVGAWRAGPGSPAGAQTFVDLVNRCPEVTSTIPRNERDYFAWAFTVALVDLQAAGVATAGVFSEVGPAALALGAAMAWGGGVLEPPESVDREEL